ncbi:MAG: enoyl-[acyl-carrier protein] reductase III [Myxococcota bacterium]
MSDVRWALILGASSGFGAAAARAFAAEGYNILGVHLDRRVNMPKVDALCAELAETGREVRFFNTNAADETTRQATITEITAILAEHGGRIGMLLHSLAFGSLRPFVPDPADPSPVTTRRQLDMTLNVMANSLVYWCQDLLAADLLERARIFAMTSSGGHIVWPQYGPVSAAKAALESHIRQLSMELAPYGHTANAILAGVTDTPALSRIPGAASLMEQAAARNPHRRLTRPEDVAACMVALARPETYWMTGNIIRVDGGEDVCA